MLSSGQLQKKARKPGIEEDLNKSISLVIIRLRALQIGIKSLSKRGTDLLATLHSLILYKLSDCPGQDSEP
jgi:hypothetical protein